jgi:hypothetical protein
MPQCPQLSGGIAQSFREGRAVCGDASACDLQEAAVM